MRGRALAAGLMLGAASLAPIHAHASDQSGQGGTLPHGGSYIIYRNPTIGAAAIDLWFRAPGAGYDNSSPGISRLAATAVAAAPLESGKSLATFVRSLGGRLTINVYPDIVGVGVIVPADSARRAVAAITSAYFAPSIDDNALKTAQRDLAVLGVQKRYSSDEVLHDQLFARIFSDGSAHFPPIPSTVPEITKIPLAQVTSFAKRAFRSGNATLTLTGNVDPNSVAAVTAGSGGNPDAPIDSTLASSPQPVSVVPATVGGIGMAWVGPAIADEKTATAMDFLADYLFRDETGLVNKGLDPASGNYVSGQFITLHHPGVMLVTIGGKKSSEVQQRVTDALTKLQQPLDSATFAAAREAFLYHLASDTQLPEEQADNLGWYASEGNPGYAPSDPQSSYWTIARALDPGFVASVVRQYLSHPVTVQLQVTESKESSS